MPDADVVHPPEAFRASAVVTDPSVRDRAAEDPVAYWADRARELHWSRGWDTTLAWDPPHARWFDGGRLNASVNCVDRHVDAGHGERVAFAFEGEPGDTRTITYAELRDEVSRTANALRELGVQRGDRVAVYLPVIAELPITMLACARIGAVHSVVFAGFSAAALRDRIVDAGCTVLVTADGAYRRGAITPLKANADEALRDTPSVRHVLVVRRTGNTPPADGDTRPDAPMAAGRDVWWHDTVARQPATCVPVDVDAEELLYLLYTSGTTGEPKGIMHTTGGYLTQVAATHRDVFDVHADTDVYWCLADLAWVTGHSYGVYGPLLNGVTSVLYEGAPDHPTPDRVWRIVERYGVTQLYTAPTLIRAFRKWGEHHLEGHDLSSLRLLGTVGESIDPDAWRWYHDVVGGGRCPIVDTWWQTETGAIMVAPLPGITPTKPGSATLPLPGISVSVRGDDGEVVDPPGRGALVVDEPWPAMLRGIWGDEERYRETYWARFGDRYLAGDGAMRDEDGDVWLLGRTDDVMNVAGHRLSTIEVESALVAHPAVVEAAVTGRADERTGQAIVAFVTLHDHAAPADATAEAALGRELRDHVGRVLSPIAKPASVVVVDVLPKNRSGKIMRRLLRDVAEGKRLGDTTTLADPASIEAVRGRYDRACAGRSG